MKKIRCAIYTRQSSEEGLDQEFNSLHAQREACASYIASQKHEGWVPLPQHYDDGGISGGTLERAGLKRLLQDVDEGLVDQIVVYKIDRLTRSLADFAKLVDRLDAADASFVSVTQSFNTATSMGRLTLNVLLSFAQFEREVTAERIRDKIAASKKKGLWMGGTIPLGYEPDGRTLKIVEEEAKTVRTLFDLYLQHGSIKARRKWRMQMHPPSDDSCLQQSFPIDSVVPYANNARTHSKKQVRQIADSIRRFGFCNPVLIADDNTIIAGHWRVEAAKLIGMTEVPVRKLSHLSRDEVRAYILADNKLAENAGWDRDLLAIEMQGLMDLDFDIEDLGFSTVEIDVTIGGEQTASSKAVRGTKRAGLTCRRDVHSHPR